MKQLIYAIALVGVSLFAMTASAQTIGMTTTLELDANQLKAAKLCIWNNAIFSLGSEVCVTKSRIIRCQTVDSEVQWVADNYATCEAALQTR